jgi:polyhydroxyalkanoate synthase
MGTILRGAGKLLRKQAALAGEMGRILAGRSELQPPKGDRRFADPSWQERLPRMGLQSYLAGRQALLDLVDELGLAEKNARRGRFLTSLVADAVAPSNFLLTNPAALRRLRETRGASLLRGMRRLAADVAANGAMPAQVEGSAFRVGQDLATTPGAVVFRNEMLELIQYAPAGATVHQRPLLLIPPQINKYYVMDLAPGKSLTRFAVDNGIQFFTVSWRNPTAAQRDWGLEKYLAAVKEVVGVVCAVTGTRTINTMGVCAGGITLSLLLAHLAASGDRRVRSATLLVTLLGGETGLLGLFATPRTLALARRYGQARGVLRGRELARVFAWLRPNDLVWSYWVNNYLMGNEPPAVDMLFWNNDTTSLPARLHGDFLDILLRNPFQNPGSLSLLGTPIDVGKVGCDAYVIGGTTDHITPWQSCYTATQLLGGPRQFVLSSGGHIQSIVNPPGSSRSTFFTNPALPADAAEWQAGAQQHAGSWWPHWMGWLTARSGRRKAALGALGSAEYTAREAAPGTYVHG